MYSYEDKIRAVELYIKLVNVGCRALIHSPCRFTVEGAVWGGTAGRWG